MLTSVRAGSFGASIEICGPDEAVRSVLGRLSSSPRAGRRGAEPPDASIAIRSPASGQAGRVCLDGRVIVVETDEAELARRAVSELHLAVAVHARDGLFVHAGAVSWRGVGIVLPGRSMAGKSMLVRALVESGADYYSDEYAVLDPAGLLHPYAKPLSIRCPDGSIESVLPERVGAVGTVPVPVGVVVSTRHEPDAVWAPQPLHGASSVLPLVDNTVVARFEPERMLQATAAVAEMAMIVDSARPEATETAIEVLALADQVADRWAA